jgi:dimethylargininase
MASATRNLPVTLARRAAAALISGFAVAAVTHIAIVVAYFIANGSAAANTVPISDYFLPASLVLFVLYSIAAFLWANRHWMIAFLVGLLTGAIAAALGIAYGIVAGGTAWSDDALLAVLSSLVGTNLVVLIAAAVVAATVGRWAWFTVISAARHPVAVVRQPSSRLADGEITHQDRVEVDQVVADAQWETYLAALEGAGFRTVEAPVADDFPDSVFVEDALVVFGGTAVLTSPGAESRRGEQDALGPVARKLGLRVRSIDLPGTLDGGDVLKVGNTVYVGAGARTNGEGIRQLREIVLPLGYTVVAVPVSAVLHLKSAVTALPDGTVVGFAGHVDDPRVFQRFLALPEPGAAVVVLSDDTVLMAASVPQSIAVVESLGYQVVSVDVSEFEKLEGCVTCLSVRVR